MKTREQIIEYLGIDIDDKELMDLWVKTAQEIENKYKEELSSGEYGYGLSCDLDVVGRLEDAEFELIEIENINDVVIYKKVLSNKEIVFEYNYNVFVYYDEAGEKLFNVFKYKRYSDAMNKADKCINNYGRVEILDKYGEKVY